MTSLRGKKVLVTGGGSGIGRLMCLGYAKEGASVIILDVRREWMAETAKQLVERGYPAPPMYECDLSKREVTVAVAETILREQGPVDVLVNNAGIVNGKSFLDTTNDQIERCMNVNVVSHMWLCKVFLPPMIAANSGCVVSIASAAGLQGTAGLVDYCASKFGAVGFTEALRQELRQIGATGVKTVIVCPFFINTGMFDGVRALPGLLSWLLPILEPSYVADQVVQATKKGTPFLGMPRLVRYTLLLKWLLGARLYDWLADTIGVNRAMSTYRGRVASHAAATQIAPPGAAAAAAATTDKTA